jgi:putative heme-binding domain-containing protein
MINKAIALACSWILSPVVWIMVAQSPAKGQESSEARQRRPAIPDGTYAGMTEFTEADAEQGRINLNVICSRCHGRDGRGSKGPDLTDGIFRHARTDREIIDTISNGIIGTGMPGFTATYEDFYKPILAYIRIEGTKRDARSSQPNGNADRGRQLFVKHQCATCHWTGGEGGRRGTNLTKLTATPDYVRESMRYPDSQVDGSYQQVSLLDKSDHVINGTRLREDTYNILIMDANENLHSIAKQDLQQVKYIHQSMMPSFRDLLTESEIEDITTYLFTLQKKVPAR